MTDVDTVAMTAEEKLVADTIYEAMNRASNYSPRAQKAREFQVGVSDLGFCPERTRRILDGQVPEDTDALAAFIGTAIGDHVEKALVNVWPDALYQSEVVLTLHGEERVYTLYGHPDVVLPEGTIIDVKTDYGLADAERNGPTQQQQFQRHLYGLGAFANGMFNDDVELDQVQVGNAWIDRAAIDKRVHVNLEPFSHEVVREAGEWLDEVVYNYLHEQEAHKAPPRDMCEVICGFFEVCRLYDTDVEGLITDKRVLAAVDMYVEGRDHEKMGKRLKDQAKQHLSEVKGSTGEYQIRWTWVNPSLVPEYTRSGYDKLEVRPIKRSKR